MTMTTTAEPPTTLRDCWMDEVFVGSQTDHSIMICTFVSNDKSKSAKAMTLQVQKLRYEVKQANCACGEWMGGVRGLPCRTALSDSASPRCPPAWGWRVAKGERLPWLGQSDLLSAEPKLLAMWTSKRGRLRLEIPVSTLQHMLPSSLLSSHGCRHRHCSPTHLHRRPILRTVITV